MLRHAKVLAMLVFTAGLSCVPATQIHAQAGNGAVPTRASMVLSIVVGIINYTRWPRLGDSLRACLAGESEYFDRLRGLASSVQNIIGIPVSFVAIQGPETLAAQCDLLYVGRVREYEVKKLFEHAAGQPILSIGEGKDLCSQGGMFCLDLNVTDSREIGFSANLDTISRSKVRVNPQVLRLTSRLNKAAP
ncbi:MAG: YfiR family protein [Zoogloeaceae bacterium]|jgi:hypothetical protein|nr:YfiR family protein [Zoogloeaceae bacterium]